MDGMGGGVAMQLMVAIFQYDSDMGSREIREDKDGVMNIALVKCHDSTGVMSNWDTDKRAINSPAKLRHLRDNEYAAANINRVIPWCVVHGTPGGVFNAAAGVSITKQEAVLAAQFARAAAKPGQPVIVALDVEPYDGFWQGTEAEVDEFVREYVAAGGEQIALYSDTRESALAGIQFDHWMSHPEVVEVWPQAYWTDFGQSMKDGMDASLYPLMYRGIEPALWRPALPGDATPEDMVAAIDYAKSLGCAGVSEWRYGIFRGDTVSAVLEHVDPWAETPTVNMPEAGTQTGGMTGGAAVVVEDLSGFVQVVGSDNIPLLNDVAAGSLGTLIGGSNDTTAYVRLNPDGSVDYLVRRIPRRAFPDISQLR